MVGPFSWKELALTNVIYVERLVTNSCKDVLAISFYRSSHRLLDPRTHSPPPSRIGFDGQRQHPTKGQARVLTTPVARHESSQHQCMYCGIKPYHRANLRSPDHLVRVALDPQLPLRQMTLKYAKGHITG